MGPIASLAPRPPPAAADPPAPLQRLPLGRLQTLRWVVFRPQSEEGEEEEEEEVQEEDDEIDYSDDGVM
ncbi:hypothetical protein TRIATDRAFT_159417 [Trichoderma atroviride IMI 206040]|uniref:Uncharacterized protein n=1 Tax=Hypocrea atroviridis (strain ATCC 20476 / IMI 206040) TaxID=452589 RepID=G9PB21_HYPAI|nr:uncharacterized protein TRIATDRAFT_159417 [Trichoderma atroviride IMI 206040]EHK40202.1 hypothetical protein TRIATDRAFT_159417 [Trichoderma atroviride IMI 206040]